MQLFIFISIAALNAVCSRDLRTRVVIVNDEYYHFELFKFSVDFFRFFLSLFSGNVRENEKAKQQTLIPHTHISVYSIYIILFCQLLIDFYYTYGYRELQLVHLQFNRLRALYVTSETFTIFRNSIAHTHRQTKKTFDAHISTFCRLGSQVERKKHWQYNSLRLFN